MGMSFVSGGQQADSTYPDCDVQGLGIGTEVRHLFDEPIGPAQHSPPQGVLDS